MGTNRTPAHSRISRGIFFRCDLAPAHRSVRLPAQVMLEVASNNGSLYHEGQGYKHPLATYNTSILAVSRRMIRVCEYLPHALIDVGADRWILPAAAEELLERQDALLDALMEHTEDCRKILNCFAPKSDRCYQHVIDRYESHVQEYRDHIGAVVNHIKHSQGRLRIAQMRSGYMSVLGYFAEQVMQGGTLGPHMQLHKGGHAAWSFNRNIRYHAAWMFAISKRLADAISEIRCVSSVDLVPSEEPENDTMRLLGAVSSLQSFVFPDEMDDPWPHISLPRSRGKNTRRLSIELPATSGTALSTRRGEFHTSLMGDGVSNKYQMPYLGKDGWRSFKAVQRSQAGFLVTYGAD